MVLRATRHKIGHFGDRFPKPISWLGIEKKLQISQRQSDKQTFVRSQPGAGKQRGMRRTPYERLVDFADTGTAYTRYNVDITAVIFRVEHSNSGKKKFLFDSIRFGNLINLPLVH